MNKEGMNEITTKTNHYDRVNILLGELFKAVKRL